MWLLLAIVQFFTSIILNLSSTIYIAPTQSHLSPTFQRATSTPQIAQSAMISPTTVVVQKSPPKASAVIAQPQTSLAPVAAVITAAQVEQANEVLRASLVNILCTSISNNSAISGSGVMLPNGIVLTNAHVAQFFLLRDYPHPNTVDCVVRTGAPAAGSYTAQLLYLPPTWIQANANQIGSSEEMGTGADDFAFLLTNAPASPLSMATNEFAVNEQVLIGSYPAQYLGATTIVQNLFPATALATTDALYTFTPGGETIDEVSLSSSVISQSGSSGGPILRLEDDALGAIITTQTEGTTTAQRRLQAITLSYIDRELKKFGEGGIVTLISGDVSAKADTFDSTTAPSLTQQLVAVLDKK